MAKRPLKKILLAAGILILAGSSSPAQQPSEEKPQAGFVRILNAATVKLKEPWRAGVNLSFKDQPLAVDMRGGEAAGYRQIMFRGKDSVDFIATQSNQKVGSVPAAFEKDAFYTLLITGAINESGFNLKPLVFKDFPIPEERKRDGMALIRLFNGVDLFPIAIQLDDAPPFKVTPMSFKEVYLAPGEHKLKTLFNYFGKIEEINSRIIVRAGSMFTVVAMVCPETGDRPTLKSWDDSAQMQDALGYANPEVQEGNSATE